MIYNELPTIVINETSPLPPTYLKGKRVHSLSPMKGTEKKKKSRGPFFPLDLLHAPKRCQS